MDNLESDEESGNPDFEVSCGCSLIVCVAILAFCGSMAYRIHLDHELEMEKEKTHQIEAARENGARQ